MDVFRRALVKLRERSDLPSSEDGISDHLAVSTREAAFELGLDYPPKRELPKQPAACPSAPGVGKRPDFTCEVRDIAAREASDAWLDYHVECKCLGEPSSRTWIYNKNYVDKGIRRFMDPEYGYGERASSGAMIGYILSMSFESILEEVNGYLAEPSALGDMPAILFPSNRRQGIAQTSQTLARDHLAPRRFRLRHLWVDLREGPASA